MTTLAKGIARRLAAEGASAIFAESGPVSCTSSAAKIVEADGGGLFAADRPDQLPFPIERPSAVSNRSKMDRIIRRLLIPAARTAQRTGLC